MHNQAPPSALTVSATALTCSVATATITITAPTGTGMTYSIDGVDYTNTTGIFTNLIQGTHNVTAKSIEGCLSPSTDVTFVSFTELDLKVLLEGAFQTATGTIQTIWMRTLIFQIPFYGS